MADVALCREKLDRNSTANGTRLRCHLMFLVHLSAAELGAGLAFGVRARNTHAFEIARANGDVKLHLVVEIAFKLGASQNRTSASSVHHQRTSTIARPSSYNTNGMIIFVCR